MITDRAFHFSEQVCKNYSETIIKVFKVCVFLSSQITIIYTLYTFPSLLPNNPLPHRK